MSFVASGLVTKIYIWPWVQRVGRGDALIALIAPHAFRFIGLSFLVPGVVSPSLPPAFAVPAAYGDLVAALLAVATVVALSRSAAVANGLAWLFNVWGTADFFLAFYQGLIGARIHPSLLGAAFFIPTVAVPPLLITHGLIFWVLLRRRSPDLSSSPLRARG
jgi:hypothetical protein